MGCRITGDDKLWPFGIVPFVIRTQDFPSPAVLQMVNDAIAHWNNNTVVRFVPRKHEGDYVEFRGSAKACESPVGCQGGCQAIHCAVGNGFNTGSVIHEMGHAVGLWHEQSREDRNAFVTYFPENVQAGEEHNFDRHVNDGEDVSDYDFGSIMEYPFNGFSKNPGNPHWNTLAAVQPVPAGVTVGQRSGLSAGDIATVRYLYSPWETGNLLFYRDKTQDGTGDVANPRLIGRTGWNQFRSVFSPGDGIIYAVTDQGNLLFYRDKRRDGVGPIQSPRIIGRGGWDAFSTVLAGGDGVLYAITSDGNLLFYKDHHQNGTGDVSTPSVIGKGGWNGFRSVLSGGDGIIYAITAEGNLLFYRDRKRDGTGDVANPTVIGRGGWDQFLSVFSPGKGHIYAITSDGNLLYYRDRKRDGTGDVANPGVIGRGGWNQFKAVVAGGDGILYAIVK